MAAGIVHVQKDAIVISVTGQNSKPWTITSFEVIGGQNFIEVNKRDHGFTRFIGGTSKKTLVRDCTFLDELRRLRQTESMKQRIELDKGLSGRDLTPHQARKQRAQARTYGTYANCDSIVTILRVRQHGQ